MWVLKDKKLVGKSRIAPGLGLIVLTDEVHDEVAQAFIKAGQDLYESKTEPQANSNEEAAGSEQQAEELTEQTSDELADQAPQEVVKDGKGSKRKK